LLKMPAMPQPLSEAMDRAMAPASGKAVRKPAPVATKKRPAAGRSTAAAGKSSTPARKRAR
jgi:hypothetical protein